jgi:hypothetical protein
VHLKSAQYILCISSFKILLGAFVIPHDSMGVIFLYLSEGLSFKLWPAFASRKTAQYLKQPNNLLSRKIRISNSGGQSVYLYACKDYSMLFNVGNKRYGVRSKRSHQDAALPAYGH